MARDLDTEFASLVTAALDDDATACQWMHLTDMWLASSRTALDASSQGGTGESARLDAVRLVEAATRAQSAATINQARTRDALMNALDVLGPATALHLTHPTTFRTGFSWTPIAAAGLVQATAIAITAEAHLAAVVQAQTDEAARKAAAAVDVAARTVAHAAEDARTMHEITATLAADQVAETATRAATEMQTRADTLDTSTLAAGETRSRRSRSLEAVTAAAAVVAATHRPPPPPRIATSSPPRQRSAMSPRRQPAMSPWQPGAPHRPPTTPRPPGLRAVDQRRSFDSSTNIVRDYIG